MAHGKTIRSHESTGIVAIEHLTSKQELRLLGPSGQGETLTKVASLNINTGGKPVGLIREYSTSMGFVRLEVEPLVCTIWNDIAADGVTVQDRVVVCVPVGVV